MSNSLVGETWKDRKQHPCPFRQMQVREIANTPSSMLMQCASKTISSVTYRWERSQATPPSGIVVPPKSFHQSYTGRRELRRLGIDGLLDSVVLKGSEEMMDPFWSRIAMSLYVPDGTDHSSPPLANISRQAQGSLIPLLIKNQFTGAAVAKPITIPTCIIHQ